MGSKFRNKSFYCFVVFWFTNIFITISISDSSLNYYLWYYLSKEATNVLIIYRAIPFPYGILNFFLFCDLLSLFSDSRIYSLPVLLRIARGIIIVSCAKKQLKSALFVKLFHFLHFLSLHLCNNFVNYYFMEKLIHLLLRSCSAVTLPIILPFHESKN